jgi:hypothetical protein
LSKTCSITGTTLRYSAACLITATILSIAVVIINYHYYKINIREPLEPADISGANVGATSPSGLASPSGTGIIGTPTCGVASDGRIKIPSDWATFTGPAGKGQTATDSSFGCTFTQITDSTIDCGTNVAISVYYNTTESLSADDAKVWLICGDGGKYIVDWKTKYPRTYTVIPHTRFPAVSGIVIWDRADANSFFGINGTNLNKYTLTNWPTCVISSTNCTIRTTTIHRFASTYPAGCFFSDEPDMGQDGKHLLFTCQVISGGGVAVILWNLETNNADVLYNTTCTGTGGIQPACLHKVQITADEGELVQFNVDGSSGEEGLVYWNPSKGCASTNSPGTTSLNGGQFQCRVQSSTDHIDTGFDLNGNSIVGFGAQPGIATGLNNPCADVGGGSYAGLGIFLVAKVQNTRNPTPNCPWGSPVTTPGYHIGYRGSSSQPWILLSMFDTRGGGTSEWFGNSSNYRPPVAQSTACDSGSGWCLYEDEIILANVNNNSLTGNGIWRLAHGYCLTEESFWNQCQASLSRDGKYIALNSGMQYGPTGCPRTWHSANDCENVYIISAANGAPLF